ncbi:MAG: nucleotidyltransferase domain-containing protein [Verrucomicrobiales bacterium]
MLTPTEHQIRERLARVEEYSGVRLLFAAEAGSRAWGFASPDSDFDVRFVFARSPERYLSVRALDEQIGPIMEGDLDLAGWDLRKALRLLAKSNGPLLEWLGSPIRYAGDDRLVENWRALAAEVLCPRRLAAHYAGMANGAWQRCAEQGAAASAKRLLYAARALLAARWVATRAAIPPVRFADLVAGQAGELPPGIPAALDQLAAAKRELAESDPAPPCAELRDFLRSETMAIAATVEALEPRAPDLDRVDAFFRESLGIGG